MSDIVKMLRDKWRHSEEGCYEAANEIERLRTELTSAKERGDILSDAIYFAIEVNDDCVSWLSDWFHGEPEAMRELDKWRKKIGK